MEKKCKKAKWLFEEALKIAVKRKEEKNKGEKERYTHLNAEFQRIARRDKNQRSMQRNRGKTIEWERLEIFSRKLEIPREHTGHSQHSLPTTQEMTLHMDITTWSIPKSD